MFVLVTQFVDNYRHTLLPHPSFIFHETLRIIIICIVIATARPHCQMIPMYKTSQPISLPLHYFVCLFRHKPINSGLSLQTLINPFRTEIMLNTGDWGQAWNYPPSSVVMTKFTQFEVCVCVLLPPHPSCLFCVCLSYLLITTNPLLKLQVCIASLLSLACA